MEYWNYSGHDWKEKLLAFMEERGPKKMREMLTLGQIGVRGHRGYVEDWIREKEEEKREERARADSKRQDDALQKAGEGVAAQHGGNAINRGLLAVGVFTLVAALVFGVLEYRKSEPASAAVTAPVDKMNP